MQRSDALGYDPDCRTTPVGKSVAWRHSLHANPSFTSCLSDFLLFLLSCETYETEIPSEAFQGDPREAFLRAALGTAIVWLGLEGSALLWTA